MNYKVSVIVPIYKVEKFIARCASNLFRQTLDAVQFIFVDDCSPDGSMAILQDIINTYPHLQDAIIVCTHSENRGLPSARNTGLKKATAEFVLHCDSDDWLECDALELLYKKALAEHADIVWCDWYLSFQNNERYMSQQIEGKTVIIGEEVIKLMLGGRLKYNVWNKLVRRTLYIDHHIHFPDGYGMGEDMTMIKLFAFTERVTYLPKALYHYVQLNNEAFTKKTTAQHLEQIKYNVDDVVHFLLLKYGHTMDNFIHYFKLNVKLPFLISADKESYERWNLWYPESNAYIDSNPQFNTRTKLIQKAAIKRQYWVLKLYYILVIRFVYGIIYK